MAIRVISSLRRKKRTTKPTILGGLLCGHGGQQGQHPGSAYEGKILPASPPSEQKNVRRPKGYAPLPAYEEKSEEKSAESASMRSWRGHALRHRPRGA